MLIAKAKSIDENDLYAVCDRTTLFAFLYDQLNWPVDPEDTFTYQGPQMHGDIADRAEVSQIVPFATGDPFTIMLVEFETKFRRTDLREILRNMREEIRTRSLYGGRKMDEIVFVCTTENYGGIRFVHFEAQAGRQPKMSVFGWDCRRMEGTRTLRDINLPALRLSRTSRNEVDWQVSRWYDAWSIEKVTEVFFNEYKLQFGHMMASVQNVKINPRLFTQRLFNRLMFVQFLSKKDWLNRDRNYLGSLWALACDHSALTKTHTDKRSNFYSDFLWPLFFRALNTPTSERPADAEWSEMSARLGDIPFLNGGLFSRQDEDDDLGAVTIANDAFNNLLKLFDQFNFTLDESTPDDIEVAIDPEMLGKVFERLVTDAERHGTGSYYTPRNVVSFMCREAIKNYLGGGAAVTRFVDIGEPDQLHDPEAVLDALRRVTVCEPACGSGAYLLGMMQELLRLREKLFAKTRNDYKRVYDRKLEIIQRNLYGVDKDPFAVNIAMLRLWLALVVDNEAPVENVLVGIVDVSLPNLKFKIQCGDALLAPVIDSQGLQLFGEQYAQDADELRMLHDEYFAPPHHDRQQRSKLEIEADLNKQQQKIALLIGSEATGVGLDWCVRFAEVFASPTSPSHSIDNMTTGGFDIVLANPPYVRVDERFKGVVDPNERQSKVDAWKAYRKLLVKSNNYETLYEKWDLYIPFLERAYQLLRPGGHMVFIISDAYNAAKYADRSHDYFILKSCVTRIDFCSDIDLFDAKINNTILFFSRNLPDDNCIPVRVKRWGKAPTDFADNAEMLHTVPQNDFGSALFRTDGERPEPHKQGIVRLADVCYVSWGMRPCSDDSYPGTFVKGDLLSSTPDHIHTKLFVEGKDILKWVAFRQRYLEWGTARAPSHFARQTFPELYTVAEKLFAADISSSEPRVAYDDQQRLCNNSISCCVPWHLLRSVHNRSIQKTAKYKSEMKANEKLSLPAREDLEILSLKYHIKYLLGIMNSEYARKWLARHRRSKIHIYPDDWKQLPIPNATPEQQADIAALVQKCLDAKGVDCGEWEADIDARVGGLYGL